MKSHNIFSITNPIQDLNMMDISSNCRPYIFCINNDFDSFINIVSGIEDLYWKKRCNKSLHEIILIDNHYDIICYKINLPAFEATILQYDMNYWNISSSLVIEYPFEFKIDKIVMDYLNSSSSSSIMAQFNLSLVIECNIDTICDISDDIKDFHHIHDTKENHNYDYIHENSTWLQLISNNSQTNVTCQFEWKLISSNFTSAAKIRLNNLSNVCVIQIVNYIISLPKYIFVHIESEPVISNYNSRKIIQGDVDENYHSENLTGRDQICGVADTGVNDISCFFIDNGNSSTRTTNRLGKLEPNRRKIIQYNAFADGLDDKFGHGTHVIGSLIGNTIAEYSSMNGIAKEAKVSFFDIGMTNTGALIVPNIETILDFSYTAGARVHSNSWGSMSGAYGIMSHDLDSYLYLHSDNVVFFAAGNLGQYGISTILSPANSKNAIAVGAVDTHHPISDLFLQKQNVAQYSSIGPTFDMRIKPDILLPGTSIISSFAGSHHVLQHALESNWKGEHVCAVHELSGTSMSTPFASGSGLLIRQYFMDPKFWATICNKYYDKCKKGAFTPSGYLLKAMILHSGQSINRRSKITSEIMNAIGTSTPDYHQGYGSLNLRNILPLKSGKGLDPALDLIVFDELAIEQNSTYRFDLELTSVESIKITICWYDAPNPIKTTAKLLLNDIDLILMDHENKVYIGNMPTPTLNTKSELIFDTYNPQEQIYLRNPRIINNSTTIYKIFIRARKLTKHSEKVALVVTTSGIIKGPFRDDFSKYLIDTTNHYEFERDTTAFSIPMNTQAQDLIEIPFSTSLGVKFKPQDIKPDETETPYYNGLVPDKKMLSMFNQTGRLTSVSLKVAALLDDKVTISGSDTWFLTIVITSPNKSVVQVSIKT